jgi:hypothetical protein
MGVPFSWKIRSPYFDDCITGVTPSRVLKSLLGLILGCSLIPCLGYYSSDSSFCSLLKEELTLLKKAPNSSGSDILEGISLCVFLQVFATRFLHLACEKYEHV